jgi:hypothetical protein
MTDLDRYLAGCDAMLAEADLLIARLAASPDVEDPELAATRDRIAVLRREVDRLRGMKIAHGRSVFDPKRTDFPQSEMPWPSRGQE